MQPVWGQSLHNSMKELLIHSELVLILNVQSPMKELLIHSELVLILNVQSPFKAVMYLVDHLKTKSIYF